MNEYAKCMASLLASAFIGNHCRVDMQEKYNILKKLKTLYVSNLVNKFINLNISFNMLLIKLIF